MPVHDFVDIGDVLKHELLQGTIVTLDTETDTCTVSVGGVVYNALVFYHCEPDSTLRSNGAIQDAATGFQVGDQVFVMKKIGDAPALSDVKVVGLVNGCRHCDSGGEGYYVVYKKDGGLSIATCDFLSASVTVNDTRPALTDLTFLNLDSASYVNTETPVAWFIKKFSHNALTNGVRTKRDLYYIFTSILFSETPFTGWVNFCTANPAHALVTNTLNTEITYSAQLMTDMQTVNYNVNHDHTYASEPLGHDNWKIMTPGQTGDCEDFALTKAQALLDLGYPASALHIECSQIDNPGPGTRAGHAWLVVQTTTGDYALDLNNDSVGLNAALTVGGKELYTRKRQIGSKWAFISPFSPVRSCVNAYLENYFSYIFDPLLNIMHPLALGNNYHSRPFSTLYYENNMPLEGPRSPSVNFSEDNNYIYWENDGNTYKYQLDESVLTLLSSAATVVPSGMAGFIGRSGTLKTCDLSESCELGDVFLYSVNVIAPEGYFDYEPWYARDSYITPIQE
jgi:predicted transglutaminase-like cysteine proteinase